MSKIIHLSIRYRHRACNKTIRNLDDTLYRNDVTCKNCKRIMEKRPYLGYNLSILEKFSRWLRGE